ncbi:MAG: hypothetical protein QOI12_4066 [Alphaproteobacteria bacterium]|nr:hypothetical protein [Alphaproteobacteria bacterium]
MNHPDTLAEVARRLKAETQTLHVAMAGFLDDFYTQPGCRQAMLDPEPDLTGDAIIDATLGGVGEHLARRWSLAIPAWTEHPARFLRRPHFPTPLEGLKPLLIAQSPLAFRRRLIFVEHEPLRRARMPVGEGAR